MMSQKFLKHIAALLAGVTLALAAGSPAVADDTEIFVGQGAVNSSVSRPNILFIIDTSGSMNDVIDTQPAFDPAITYSGTCDATHVYWVDGNGTDPPNCSTQQWFYLSALTCKAAKAEFATTGTFRDRIQRWVVAANASNSAWSDFVTTPTDAIRNQYVECQSDNGNDGQTSASVAKYPKDGATGPWQNNSNGNFWNGRNRYRLFSGNYANWFYSLTANQTKIQIVKDVTKSLLDSMTGVNVGLMRYSTSAQGGMVISAVDNIATARPSLKSQIDGLSASGFTPLSETLYEAGLYYKGDIWDYGSNSTPTTSVAASRQTATPTKYKSPIEYSCQKNYIVYLTDGLPTEDVDANTKIGNLNGTSCGTNDGDCLDDMAEYLYKTDLSTLNGSQNVATYTIGFTTNFPLLVDTAQKGGGAYYTANNTASLTNAFQQITNDIIDNAATFSSPTVAVNAFNRTRNLNDLYITVFKPTTTVHWPGNLKKYRLNPITGEIQDNSTPAIDAVDSSTGYFKDSARSYWSASVDGKDVEAGGAANQIPDPATRKVYTYLTGSPSTSLTNSSNSVEVANTAITDAILNVNVAGRPTRDNLINWARGTDIKDVDSDTNVTEARRQMGDPLHSRPATVIYGGTAANPNLDDAVVYGATNDGYVHAIDPSTGTELWTFIPDVMLPKLYQIYDNASSSSKFYGVDGNIQILKVDHNNNGIIETTANPATTDRVYVYFGMRRGGKYYYALDVTDKNNPKFMWKLSNTQLPGLGETWSTPTPARINVNSASQTDPDKYTLIFGGGYEADQDPDSTTNTTAYSTDATGNRVFMVDAKSGALLWYAGGSGSGANLVLDGSTTPGSNMNNSIPADIRVIDMNNDGFADRMYAGDMGARVWRFDITNGNQPSSLVTGGVLATLGNADQGTHPASSTRRFYYAPDVSLVRKQGLEFLNLAIGSGYRASPLNTEVQDRFYSVRDKNVFTQLTQSQFNSLAKITESDLVDVTTDMNAVVPPTGNGWKINLTRSGEKVLSEARTFSNSIFFTTYTPNTGAVTSPCAPQEGQNRLFVVSVLDGDPVYNRDNPSAAPDSVSDRESNLNQGGIAPEAVFLFPTPDPGCTGNDCKPPPQCLVGLENCGVGLTNNPVRTFWTQQNIDAN